MRDVTAPAGLRGRRVLVHVCGGIAVVKVPELLTALRRAGAEVRVTMSPGALAFLSPLTLQALAGHQVAVALLAAPPAGGADGAGHGMTHLTLAAWAECQLVVPATADMCARLALGLADEIVGATALACPAPLVVAPAMEAAMWRHPATRAHVAQLAARGAVIVEPVAGRLASGREDVGRLAPVDALLAQVARTLAAAPAPAASESEPGAAAPTLAGTCVVVTSGGTREPVDPVRFLGNRSSGRMGVALAQAALRRGAAVVLVTAAPPPPSVPGLRVVEVATAEEMLAAVRRDLPAAGLVLMAAAVADWRVAEPAADKLRRRGRRRLRLELVPTADVLQQVMRERPPGCVVVGFAAETGDLEPAARAKRRAKGVDLLVANRVVGPQSAMGGEQASALIVDARGVRREVAFGPKAEVAEAVLDEAVRLVARAAGA